MTLKIITLNVNGIRSAAKKGLFIWLKVQQADVICLQEIKAQTEHLTDPSLHLEGYHAYFHSAQKKGYSGVAVYSKIKPKQVIPHLGWQLADAEGRYLQADFNHLSVASVYFPSGTMGEERQAIKYEFLTHFETLLSDIKKNRRAIILCGDWNIAHTQEDIKNWKTNQKTSGFLPAERAWLDKIFGQCVFIDAFRQLTQPQDQYTWWSHRGRAYEKNVGWRIDYQVLSPVLQNCVLATEIYKKERFSDHAPLSITYQLDLQ